MHFTTLESLVGKLGALALAAPGILIKLRWCYTALAVASIQVPLYGPTSDRPIAG